jgi:hypothetical protein
MCYDLGNSLKTVTHAKVKQRQSNGWKALDSLRAVERHAMVGEKQFLV